MSAILDWAVGKGLDALVKAHELKPLDKALKDAVTRWRDSLPPEYQDQEYWHELFISRREPQSPSLAHSRLTEALLDGVPTVDLWFAALQEAWGTARQAPDQVAFFRADARTVEPHLLVLARALHSACVGDVASGIKALVARDPLHAPKAAISEFMDDAQQSCRARMIAGWQAAGLDERQAAAFVDDVSVGSPPHAALQAGRRLTVLLGELGVGKTVVLERLLALRLSSAKETERPVIPARVRLGQVLELGLERSLDLETRGLSNAFVAAAFVEDIDALGSDAAFRFMQEARAFVAKHGTASVTATARPGFVENLAPEAVVVVPPLERKAALSLIARVAGCSVEQADYLIRRSLDAEARRPLFALLLALYWHDRGTAPKALGELLSHVVETALRQGVPDLSSAALVLQRLAVMTLDRGGPVSLAAVAGPLESSHIRQSRLVTVRDASAEFALPVLAQWFGAQALASGMVSPSHLTESAERLERWSTSLTIAAATLSHDSVSPALTVVADANPSLAAKVVRSAIQKWGLGDESPLTELVECGHRIRDTMQTWLQSLGPTAQLCGFPASGEPLPSLGLSARGAWLDTSWYSGPEDLPPVFLVSEHPLALRPLRTRGARPPRQMAWAWRWTIDELSGCLQELITHRMILAETGPRHSEMVWQTAVSLMGYRGCGSSISIEEIEASMQKLPPEVASSFEVKSLIEVTANLRARGVKALAEPWPAADLPPSRSVGMLADLFSEARLVERATAVYGAALRDYPALVARWFPRLASRMPTAVILPARLVGTIVCGDSSMFREPSIYWHFEPLDRRAEPDVAFTCSRTRPEWDDLDRLLDRVRDMRPQARAWIGVSSHRELLRIFGRAPVTDVVYSWLERDLEQAGWLGTSA